VEERSLVGGRSNGGHGRSTSPGRARGAGTAHPRRPWGAGGGDPRTGSHRHGGNNVYRDTAEGARRRSVGTGRRSPQDRAKELNWALRARTAALPCPLSGRIDRRRDPPALNAGLRRELAATHPLLRHSHGGGRATPAVTNERLADDRAAPGARADVDPVSAPRSPSDGQRTSRDPRARERGWWLSRLAEAADLAADRLRRAARRSPSARMNSRGLEALARTPLAAALVHHARDGRCEHGGHGQRGGPSPWPGAREAWRIGWRTPRLGGARGPSDRGGWPWRGRRTGGPLATLATDRQGWSSRSASSAIRRPGRVPDGRGFCSPSRASSDRGRAGGLGARPCLT